MIDRPAVTSERIGCGRIRSCIHTCLTERVVHWYVAAAATAVKGHGWSSIFCRGRGRALEVLGQGGDKGPAYVVGRHPSLSVLPWAGGDALHCMGPSAARIAYRPSLRAWVPCMHRVARLPRPTYTPQSPVSLSLSRGRWPFFFHV